MNWNDVATALSITSVSIAGIGAGVPDPYSKVVLGLSVGLANAAILAAKHEKSNGTTKTS